MSRTIVLAVDGSDCSHEALDWALGNFLRASDTIVLLHVFPHFIELEEDADGRVAAIDCKDVSVQQDLEKTVDLLENMKLKCQDLGMDTQVVVESGDARGFIPVYCQQLHANCLIIGSRGLGGLQ
eukprot:Ihof_evm2s229 gene=Ihof_evmTU2s229